jgi:Fe/S biogenesis protein NfuA
MLTVTDSARKKLIQIIEEKKQQGCYLRLRITGKKTDEFTYDLRFVEPSDQGEGDSLVEFDGLTVVIDSESAAHLPGTVINFGGLGAGGLRIDNPNPVWQDPVEQSVAQVIEHQINPGIKAHGGYVNLVGVADGVASITMSGGCQGCGMANVTLKLGIDRMIRESVPAIREVVDVTNHAEGDNPFYRSGGVGESPLSRN